MEVAVQTGQSFKCFNKLKNLSNVQKTYYSTVLKN